MLPKLEDHSHRPENPPLTRIFSYCPDCGKYLYPGFRTDCCTECWADFSGTKEYADCVASDRLKIERYLRARAASAMLELERYTGQKGVIL